MPHLVPCITPVEPPKLFESAAWSSTNLRGYTIPEIDYGTLRPIKVIAVGAGISGIALAHAVATSGPGIELQAYEIADNYSGTWHWNTYDGVRCDIPSHNYQLSFAPSSEWPEFYATGAQIASYYQGIVRDFKLEKYFKLEHEVVHAEWSDETKKWTVQVRRPDGTLLVDKADVFINAGGVLNAWKWPSIEGLHSFKGDLVHTARWKADLVTKGRRVAVVGSGSSGIQVLATIQPEAKQVYHWIRSPTWITSAFAQQFAGPGGANFHYTAEHKKRFAENSTHALKYRKMMESELNQRFKFVVQGTPEAKAALKFADADMRQKLKGHDRLIDAIVPKNFAFGCRRPTPGNGYLEALTQPNVEVYTDMFTKFTEKGFITAEGEEVEVDVVICATGFDTSFRPRYPIVSNGVNLQDLWQDYPVNSYLSIAVQGFPNYFTYYGPYGPAGHGSGAPMIEAMTRCVMSMVKKMQMECITKMEVSPKAVADFNEHAALYLQRTAWAGQCSSWFKASADRPPLLFPGNRILFIEMLYNWRPEDFLYEYGHANNRFGHWGSGFTAREHDGRDTTFYYGFLDGKDEQPDYSDVRELYTGLS